MSAAPLKPSRADNNGLRDTEGEARLASLDSGNYRANNRLVLDAFETYLEDQRGVTTLWR